MSQTLYPPSKYGVVAKHHDGKHYVIWDPTFRGQIIPKQLEIHDAILAFEFENILLWGERGTGKSRTARGLCHKLALGFPGFKYAILRTSFPELRKNHINDVILEMDRMGDGATFNKSESQAYYPPQDGKQSLGIYAQCAEEKDVNKIVGAELDLVVFDEANLFEWEHMRLIGASVRVPDAESKPYKALALYVANPIGSSAEQLHTYFIAKDAEDDDYNPNDFHAINVRRSDNPYIGEEYAKKRFVGISGDRLKAWRDGEWAFQGAAFDFAPQRDGQPWHVIQQLPTTGKGYSILKQSWVRIYRSIDDGYNPDPAVCLWHLIVGKRIITFAEKTWRRTQCKDYAKDIIEFSEQFTDPVSTYIDPYTDISTSGDVHSTFDKIEEAGIPLEKSVNDRELFLRTLGVALDEVLEDGLPRWQILAHDPATGLGCPELIKALPKMKSNPRNPNALADHKADHWPVSAAYFLMSSAADIETAEPKERRVNPHIAKLLAEAEAADEWVLGKESVQ